MKNKIITQLQQAENSHNTNGELEEGTLQSYSPCRESVLSILPGLPQGAIELLKPYCVPLPTAPKQESTALCLLTFSLSLWAWSCRELGRNFISVETIALCQAKSWRREHLSTSWGRGRGLIRPLPREVSSSLLLDSVLSPTFALLQWQKIIS